MARPPKASKNKRTWKRTMNTKPRIEYEREHDFALVLSGITELTPEVQDALFEAGCDDATISVRAGRVYLTFSRNNRSLKDAILTAIQDVKSARVGADVLRVDVCNLVTQADIARKIGRSRQLVHQYIAGIRGPGNFPAPACNLTDGVPLWYWCEVAYWLRQNDMISHDAATEAQGVALINAILEMRYHRKLDPELSEEILRSLADEPSSANAADGVGPLSP
jgi:hypothetical protein